MLLILLQVVHENKAESMNLLQDTTVPTMVSMKYYLYRNTDRARILMCKQEVVAEAKK